MDRKKFIKMKHVFSETFYSLYDSTYYWNITIAEFRIPMNQFWFFDLILETILKQF